MLILKEYLLISIILSQKCKLYNVIYINICLLLMQWVHMLLIPLRWLKKGSDKRNIKLSFLLFSSFLLIYPFSFFIYLFCCWVSCLLHVFYSSAWRTDQISRAIRNCVLIFLTRYIIIIQHVCEKIFRYRTWCHVRWMWSTSTNCYFDLGS